MDIEPGGQTAKEINVQAALDGLVALHAKRHDEPDLELSADEVNTESIGLVSGIKELISQTESTERVVDFGDGKTGTHRSSTFTDADGFTWQVYHSTDVTNDDRYEEGLESVTLSKGSSIPGEVNPPAPNISEFTDITTTKGVNPLRKIRYGYYAHPRGKQAFADNKENTRGALKGATTLLNTAKSVVKK